MAKERLEGHGVAQVGTFPKLVRPRGMWRSVLFGFFLAGLVSGCSWGGNEGASSEPSASLTISVRAVDGGPGTSLVRTFTLDCNPPRGSVRNPAAACRALADYVAHHPGPPPISLCSCQGVPLGTRLAVIRGTFNGLAVKAELSSCMCGYSPRLVRDLHIVTGLRSLSPAPTL